MKASNMKPSGMKYIQRRCPYTGHLDTVDEFETMREAKEMMKEYQMSDPSAEYYVSSRACKDWHD